MIPDAGLRLIHDACSADIWPGELPPPRDTVLERAKGVDGIVCLLTDAIDTEVMDALGAGLLVISNYAVGYDNIDLPEATKRGIPVGNTPGVLTDTTADFAFGLLMSAARRIAEGERFTRSGSWRTWGPRLLLGQDITGATLGILGFGRIGQGMAKRARGFDMQVLYYDPYCRDDAFASEVGARCVSLDTLLRESDFVSVHTPLTDATHHLIGDDALSRMKPTAALINTARGPIVDPGALYRALSKGQIACAALDVTEPEPISPDSPLLGLDNIIITPHIASASVGTRDAMAVMAAENLIAGLRGARLPNCVNPEVYLDR
jgi:glyoxylate reductase